MVGLSGLCSNQRYDGRKVLTFMVIRQECVKERQSVENREKNSEFREETEQRRWMVIL